MYLFIIGELFNTTFFLSTKPEISEINLFEKVLQYVSSYDFIILPVIVNIIISITRFILPKIIRGIITYRLRKNTRIIQINQLIFSKH